MIRPLKIAHTSDVHLHDGADGAAERDAFARVVDAVRATQSDLFLIAGDLFDHNRVESGIIGFVLDQLARVTCPTVIIAGNHDCWVDSSALRRTDFSRAGSHVTLLAEPEGRQIELPEIHATVWGRCMLDHIPTNRPMAGAPTRVGNLWHIGMAHGLYAEDPDTPRSSLITPREIETSGFDYLALGHVHAHRQVRHGGTLACYPGVPAPDGSKAGCFALVELAPGAPATATALPLG
jgi:DNA repair protein SbcD/Mre11